MTLCNDSLKCLNKYITIVIYHLQTLFRITIFKFLSHGKIIENLLSIKLISVVLTKQHNTIIEMKIKILYLNVLYIENLRFKFNNINFFNNNYNNNK